VAPVTRVKICGVTRAEDIRLCVEAGAHALGFVVEYPLPVPWNLDRMEARDLMRRVPPCIARVAVVGDDPGTIVALAEALNPHAIQLHGSEPLLATAKIVAELKRRRVPVIKALRFNAETGKTSPSCEDPLKAARLIEETGVDALLLDSVSDRKPAGTGKSIDWGIARAIRESVGIPIVLAGGLHAGNVGTAISAVRPYAVDVISGVEHPVGRKDPEKMRAFFEAVSQKKGTDLF